MSKTEEGAMTRDPAGDERVGRVVATLPGGRLVLDVGLRDGVRVDDVFAVFEPGDAVHDPDGGAVLGVLDRVKAHLIAEHVQPGLTQLGPLPEPESAGSGAVLSAVLARTSVPPPRNSAPGRRTRPAVGDRARRLIRR